LFEVFLQRFLRVVHEDVGWRGCGIGALALSRVSRIRATSFALEESAV
jgi:hypothetical protein